MNVEFSRVALEELASIERWIGRDDPIWAARVIDGVVDCAGTLAVMPNRFPELKRSSIAGVRRVNHGRYRILYRVESDRVLILHVHHGSRDTPSGLA